MAKRAPQTAEGDARGHPRPHGLPDSQPGTSSKPSQSCRQTAPDKGVPAHSHSRAERKAGPRPLHLSPPKSPFHLRWPHNPISPFQTPGGLLSTLGGYCLHCAGFSKAWGEAVVLSCLDKTGRLERGPKRVLVKGRPQLAAGDPAHSRRPCPLSETPPTLGRAAPAAREPRRADSGMSLLSTHAAPTGCWLCHCEGLRPGPRGSGVLDFHSSVQRTLTAATDRGDPCRP